jgi:hypothetical protein
VVIVSMPVTFISTALPFWVGPYSVVPEWVLFASPGWLVIRLAPPDFFYDPKHSLMNFENIFVAFIVNACVYLLTILGVSLRADTRSRRKRDKLL